MRGGIKRAIGGIAPVGLALAVAATSGAESTTAKRGEPKRGQRPTPHVATSGNKSELIDRVPIESRPGRNERVAMRIPPRELEPLEPRSRIRANAEVQVSTTCIVPSDKRCIGRSYGLSPFVSARIVLARGPKARSPSIPLSEPHTVLCKQRRPNRNHHCTIAIRNEVTRFGRLKRLPCKPDRCYVNLLVSAHNRKAEPGHFVVLGGDKPDGSLEQDKGRLTVLQADERVRAPAVFTNAALLHRRLPLTIADSDKRRIVYAMPVSDLREGDVLAFDVEFVSAISALPFNTFVTSRVILTTGPRRTKPKQHAKDAIKFNGQATEANGFDCTLGPSGYSNPCITHKTGAIRIKRDIVHRKTGTPMVLWLNVVAGAKPLLATEVRNANMVSLAAQPNGLTVWRYSP